MHTVCITQRFDSKEHIRHIVDIEEDHPIDREMVYEAKKLLALPADTGVLFLIPGGKYVPTLPQTT